VNLKLGEKREITQSSVSSVSLISSRRGKKHITTIKVLVRAKRGLQGEEKGSKAR